MDGRSPARRRIDSAPNENDWILGTVADLPPSTGEAVDASFDRHSEILGFLSDAFGPYPFSASGGLVDDPEGLGFALENQTRPIYAREFFSNPGDGDSVVVHELAHQWFGDSLAVARWQHIWLNEGFATYAEWLWSEDQGLGTAQEIFDFLYEAIPPDDPFWQIVVGDPGAATSLPTSSSRWPSRCPDSSWTRCSRPGCSRRAVLTSAPAPVPGPSVRHPRPCRPLLGH